MTVTMQFLAAFYACFVLDSEPSCEAMYMTLGQSTPSIAGTMDTLWWGEPASPELHHEALIVPMRIKAKPTTCPPSSCAPGPED